MVGPAIRDIGRQRDLVQPAFVVSAEPRAAYLVAGRHVVGSTAVCVCLAARTAARDDGILRVPVDLLHGAVTGRTNRVRCAERHCAAGIHRWRADADLAKREIRP